MRLNETGMAYIGKIIDVKPIESADFIACFTVVCGTGGKWKGVAQKSQLVVGDKCTVYLPDAVIPPNEDLVFMKKHNWRVRMCKFKGAPSEVLILPCHNNNLEIGHDCTNELGVTKYSKPIPAQLAGKCKGNFPQFIPKTDEPNYQRFQHLVDMLTGRPYYITVKYDGSSSTAYKRHGEFGVCSRNLELYETETNAYWLLANKYELPERIPEGYAIQWETCGPKIQGNPLKLKEPEGYIFSAYDIENQRYLAYNEMKEFLRIHEITMPMAEVIEEGLQFNAEGIERLGEGFYASGNQREGIVVRSQTNLLLGDISPVSFKVINLNYENN